MYSLVSSLHHFLSGKKSKNGGARAGGEGGADGNENGRWADRTGGFRDEGQKVEIAIGDAVEEAKPKNRAVPVWITNSAIEQEPDADANADIVESMAVVDEPDSTAAPTAASMGNDDDDEITQILLRHERKDGPKAVIPGTFITAYFL